MQTSAPSGNLYERTTHACIARCVTLLSSPLTVPQACTPRLSPGVLHVTRMYKNILEAVRPVLGRDTCVVFYALFVRALVAALCTQVDRQLDQACVLLCNQQRRYYGDTDTAFKYAACQLSATLKVQPHRKTNDSYVAASLLTVAAQRVSDDAPENAAEHRKRWVYT